MVFCGTVITVKTLKTLKLRIKDKHCKVLVAMAREVNQVFNFCNETSMRAIGERHQWLSGYDLQKLTAGFSKCEGVTVGSGTVQLVCAEYATRRKQFKKAAPELARFQSKIIQVLAGLGSVQGRPREIQGRANRVRRQEVQPVG